MTALQSNQRYCRDCGAVNLAQRGSCWLCNGSLAGPAWNPPAKERPAWMPDRDTLDQINFYAGATTGVVVAVVGMGALINHYSFSKMLAVVAVLTAAALISLGYSYRRQRADNVGPLDVVLMGFGYAVVALLFGMAVVIALLIVCIGLVFPVRH